MTSQSFPKANEVAPRKVHTIIEVSNLDNAPSIGVDTVFMQFGAKHENAGTCDPVSKENHRIYETLVISATFNWIMGTQYSLKVVLDLSKNKLRMSIKRKRIDLNCDIIFLQPLRRWKVTKNQF